MKNFKRALSSVLAFVLTAASLAVANVSTVFASVIVTDYDINSTTVPEPLASQNLTYYHAFSNSQDNVTLVTSDTEKAIWEASSAGATSKGSKNSGKFLNSTSAVYSGEPKNPTITFNIKTAGTLYIDWYGGGNSGSNNNCIFTDKNSSKTTCGSSGTKNGSGVQTKIVFGSSDTGTCTLAKGTGDYYPAAIAFVPDNTTTVNVTGVSLTPETATIAIDETTTLTATVEPSNATNKNVTWSSDTPSVATVENGVVTGIAEGTATITVTTADGGFTDTATITVEKVSVQGISLSDTSIEVGETKTLVPTFTPENATNKNVTWSSDTPSVATIENGVVTGIAVGTATITATSAENADITATATITVNPKSATQKTYYKFYVNDADKKSNGDSNVSDATDVFLGTTEGNNSFSSGKEFNGTISGSTYNITKRTSTSALSATTNITIKVPNNAASAKFYIVAASNGSSPKTLTLKNSDGSYETTGTIPNDTATLVTFEGLVGGTTYTLSSSGSTAYGFLMLEADIKVETPAEDNSVTTISYNPDGTTDLYIVSGLTEAAAANTDVTTLIQKDSAEINRSSTIYTGVKIGENTLTPQQLGLDSIYKYIFVSQVNLGDTDINTAKTHITNKVTTELQ